MEDVLHFALVGDYGKPVACGVRMWSGVPITNKWKKVTCLKCIEAQDDKDRPDKLVYREYKEMLKKSREKN